jgi:hypothetical protein
MKTVCLDEKVWDKEEYDYDDVAFGDYVVFALWDITDEEHPKLIMCDDNTHTCIEDTIEAFLDGVRYNVDIMYYSKNILLCEREYNPTFDVSKLIKCGV